VLVIYLIPFFRNNNGLLTEGIHVFIRRFQSFWHRVRDRCIKIVFSDYYTLIVK